MKSFRAKLARLVAAVLTALVVASNASAVSVGVLDYSGSGEPGVGVELTNTGIFQTTGGAAVSSLLTWAGLLPVADAVGSVRISGVALTGAADPLGPGTYFQETSGGLLEAFDAANTLLLSVSFSTGNLLVTSIGTGSQFTVGIASFGGLLAPYFVPDSATHALSLVNFRPVGIDQQTGNLLAGKGFGNGLVTGDVVPEPATMLLLGSGILGAIAARKRAA